MEIIIDDFGLEWKRKDSVVQKADYDELIDTYENRKMQEDEIRNNTIEEMKVKLCEKSDWFEKYTHAFGYIGSNFCEVVTEIAERLKETEEPFFNFDSPVTDVDKKVIRKFADWCYIHGIDFSYMSTTKKSAKQFIDDVIERYSKEQMKGETHERINDKHTDHRSDL